MKFFIDTANLSQIREARDLGILDGVTTNPSLMARENIYFTVIWGSLHDQCKVADLKGIKPETIEDGQLLENWSDREEMEK